MPLGYKVSDKSSRFLQPDGGSGVVDVVKDFQWTMQEKDARLEVPTVIVTEYQQTAGQLISSIIYFSKVVESISSGETGLLTGPKDPAEVYRYKYFAEPTGFVYRFPYFNPKHTSRTTDFGYEDGQSPFAGLFGLGGEIAKYGHFTRSAGGNAIRSTLGILGGEIPAIGSAIVGVANSIIPGKLSLENPKSWVETSEGSYSLTFDLFNTGEPEDIVNNRNLAYILKYQNSPSRRNFAIVDPTVIYDVYIPDITHLPAAYISELQITNLGNTRQMKFDNGVEKIIPEAYRFTITFTSLFMPTRNIMDGMDKGKRVTAIEDSRQLMEIVNAVQNGQFDRARSLLNNSTNLPVRDRQTLTNVIGEMEEASLRGSSNFVGPPTPS